MPVSRKLKVECRQSSHFSWYYSLAAACHMGAVSPDRPSLAHDGSLRWASFAIINVGAFRVGSTIKLVSELDPKF